MICTCTGLLVGSDDAVFWKKRVSLTGPPANSKKLISTKLSGLEGSKLPGPSAWRSIGEVSEHVALLSARLNVQLGEILKFVKAMPAKVTSTWSSAKLSLNVMKLSARAGPMRRRTPRVATATFKDRPVPKVIFMDPPARGKMSAQFDGQGAGGAMAMCK